MSTTGSCHSGADHGRPRRRAWLQALALALLLSSPMTAAFGQEKAAETPKPTPAGAAPAVASPAATVPATTPPAEAKAESKSSPLEQPAAKKAETAATPSPGVGAAPIGGSNTWPIIYGLIVVALFVLPMLVGNMIASWLRMPDYSWKISLVLGTLAASIVIVSLGQFKFGPDLAGGITLIYELAETPSAEGGAGAAQQVKMEQMIAILKRRIDPTGTREVTIREYGRAIEIIIPSAGPDALADVKRQITELGQLEFRITADPSQPNQRERAVIEQARLLAPAQKDVVIGGRKVAEWLPYAAAEFGPVDKEDGRNIVKRLAGETPEALVLVEPDEVSVTGKYLRSVSKGVDPQSGAPEVEFSFNTQGARRFQQLTSKNKPNAATGSRRYLGIVLDKRLLSAPSIESTISDRGRISGRSMTEKEVDHVVSILQEGELPLRLDKMPISEQVISPTLGADTIASGERAISISFAAIILFMLIYYRFAGFVACLALLFNLLLVVAVMVLIKAAFTLPGLAGLVLTIGMSVDANILIFERMREELKGGAALRMVVRNGFDRAMSAIVDSNLTTVISGIALYVFATDQVKGFAVTLILGIITSMYTAIFFSRLMFDICERQGWVKHLKMLKILVDPNYNFLRAGKIAITVSIVVIVVGMVGVVKRGWSLLDIDFTGGSTVAFALDKGDVMSIAQVRAALDGTELGGKNLVVVERGESGTHFSVDTSEQSVDRVKQVIQQGFAGKLQMYSARVGELEPFAEGTFTGIRAKLVVNEGPAYDPDDGVSHDALVALVSQAAQESGVKGIVVAADSPEYRPGSSGRFKTWTVRLGGASAESAALVFDRLKDDLNTTPIFPLANQISGRVSGDMQLDALKALVLSILGMVVYLWVRFQKLMYGVAAAVALVHDVLVTVGLIALSAYVVDAMPRLASALQIETFQIGLTIVAALLTIVGYSVNDTIITFDRLREIKGKSPKLTAEMVNASVNQTLSRTILTALTVFITIVILYFWGGEGIHGFAFAFLIGVVAGTYSSVYIASPLLLWLSGEKLELPSP